MLLYSSRSKDSSRRHQDIGWIVETILMTCKSMNWFLLKFLISSGVVQLQFLKQNREIQKIKNSWHGSASSHYHTRTQDFLILFLFQTIILLHFSKKKTTWKLLKVLITLTESWLKLWGMSFVSTIFAAELDKQLDFWNIQNT